MNPTLGASTRPDCIEGGLERYGRLVRALHLARAARGVPWTDEHITLPQLRALSLLAAHKEGLSGRDLAACLRVRPSAITPLVDRLVERGYVRRQEDRTDRRITRMLVTADGIAVLELMLAGQRAFMRELLGTLDEAELAAVNRAFEVLSVGLQRMVDIDEGTSRDVVDASAV